MDRFWAKVDRTDSCWNWTAARFHHGYGCFGVKQSNGKFKIKYAHRVSYELCIGKIPPGMNVLHSCDNRGCVNPAHLFIGTQADNVADAVQKGRMRTKPRYGESNPYAKLTEGAVRAIREVGRSVSQQQLAERYGVSQTLIGHVLRRTIWRHV